MTRLPSLALMALTVAGSVAAADAQAAEATNPGAAKAAKVNEEGPIPYGLAGDIACAPCGVDIDSKAASSMLTGYPIADAFDESPATAWCEGEGGLGIGQWLEVGWNEPRTVAGFELIGGFAKSWALLEKNPRIKKLTVLADGVEVNRVTLEDPLTRKPKEQEKGPLGYGTLWPVLFGPALADRQAKTIRLRIDAVYPGSKYDDTCVSQWTVYSVDPAELD